DVDRAPVSERDDAGSRGPGVVGGCRPAAGSQRGPVVDVDGSGAGAGRSWPKIGTPAGHCRTAGFQSENTPVGLSFHSHVCNTHSGSVGCLGSSLANRRGGRLDVQASTGTMYSWATSPVM